MAGRTRARRARGATLRRMDSTTATTATLVASGRYVLFFDGRECGGDPDFNAKGFGRGYAPVDIEARPDYFRSRFFF